MSVFFTNISTCLSGVSRYGLCCAFWPLTRQLMVQSPHMKWEYPQSDPRTLGDGVIVRVIICRGYLHQGFKPWGGAYILHQGCTNPGCQVTHITKCCMVASNISWRSVQLLLHVMHLAPRFLRWFLGFFGKFVYQCSSEL